MGKVKLFSLLLIAGCLTTMGIVEVGAESPTDKPSFVIRKGQKEMVLYTICRGPYEKTGPAVGKLYGLAGQKGIIPRGSPYYVYLNNPKRVASEHWLTEIRIPVGEDALKLAGKLDEMTDIKALPATTLAVAVKPEGQADPAPIYDGLYKWIIRGDYRVVDSAREVFLTNVMSGNYAQMKSEIMIPVQKVQIER